MDRYAIWSWFVLWSAVLAACRPEAEPGKTTPPPPVDTVAVAAAPPEEPPAPAPPDYDTTQWTEVVRLDPTIRLDLRYATTDNFAEIQLYECGRCFLRPASARAVVRVHHRLRRQGLGLKMYDCYRPASVQWTLWEKVPDRRYVADPRKGSMHSRGNGVDLTLVDSLGRELPMGTPYDFFGPEAHTTYTGLPEAVLANRRLLNEAMRAEGFQGIRTEWWHYSLPGKGYELADMVWNCPPPRTE